MQNSLRWRSGFTEGKSLLGNSSRNPTKYGSTTKVQRREECYIQHLIEPSDTIQGISLKYGVTVEDIKRANKLWTNDSLHLHESLLVPVPTQFAEHGSFINGQSPATSPVHSAFTKPRDSPRDSPRDQTRDSPRPARNGPGSPKHQELDTEVSANDFLSKFDTDLAKIKKNMKKMEKSAGYLEDDRSNPLTYLPRKNTRYTVRPRGHASDTSTSAVSSDDVCSDASPELVIKSRRRSKQIQSSIRQMQENEDAIFQL